MQTTRSFSLRHPLRISALTLALTGLISGCATPQPDPNDEAEKEPETVTEVTAPLPEPEPHYRPFPEDTLYSLLVAEFAARRGEYDIALKNYSEQAEATRDPGVAARAARMARYLKQADSAAANAELWAQVSPEHPEAQYSAATELGKAGKPMEALPYMERLDALGGNTNFAALAAGSLSLDTESRETILARILALPPAQNLANENDRRMAQAIMLQSLERNEEALAIIDTVLVDEPEHLQALLVQMQIYRNLGQEDKALERMAQAVETAPNNTELRLQYARLLGRTDLPAAEKQFEILVEQDPENAEYRLSLALVYRENEHFSKMRSVLEQLVVDGLQTNTAHLYLAQDAERRQDDEAAIRHYLEMTPSQFFTPSIARAGLLMLKTGGAKALGEGMDSVKARYPDSAAQLTMLESQLLMDQGLNDDALATLDRAIGEDPHNSDLLYSRSLIHEKRRDIQSAEADLRSIIAADPDNSMALNALGYTLTNLTDRYDEALELIQRALELNPGDPAIMDSLGWAYFRLGRLEESADALKQAYDKFPDHEVAAHLGEVLWAQDKQEDAIRIWKEGLQNNPDSAVIHETLDRLGVELLRD